MSNLTKNNMSRLMDDFIGGRVMNDAIWNIISPSLEPIHETLYRGMMLPKHILKEGFVLEEWYDMCHWSLDIDVARAFSLEPCPSDDYIDEIAEELELSEDEAYDTFIPVVIVLNGVSLGLRTYDIAIAHTNTNRFVSEKEITTFGINFMATQVNINYDSHGEYYVISVSENIDTDSDLSA